MYNTHVLKTSKKKNTQRRRMTNWRGRQPVVDFVEIHPHIYPYRLRDRNEQTEECNSGYSVKYIHTEQAPMLPCVPFSSMIFFTFQQVTIAMRWEGGCPFHRCSTRCLSSCCVSLQESYSFTPIYLHTPVYICYSWYSLRRSFFFFGEYLLQKCLETINEWYRRITWCVYYIW